MINSKKILELTSGDSKPKGLSKIPKFILDKNSSMLNDILPNIEEEIEKFKTTCPQPEEIKKIINKRNNLLSRLNSTSKFLTQQKNTVKSTLNTFTFILNAIKNIKRIKKGLSIGSKVIISPPGLPGVIASGISDLGDLIFDQTFTPTGISKLEKIKSGADGIQSSLDISINSIGLVSSKLLELDFLTKKCTENLDDSILNDLPSLEDFSSELNNLRSEYINSSIPGNETYRGYILNIETKKFNEKLTQSRAVALNKSNIIEYFTQYSFTLNKSVLIEEIKQILDRIYFVPEEDEATRIQREISTNLAEQEKIQKEQERQIKIQQEITQLEIDLGLLDNEISTIQNYMDSTILVELANETINGRIKTFQDSIIRDENSIKQLEPTISIGGASVQNLINKLKADIKEWEGGITYINNTFKNPRINKINENKNKISDITNRINQLKKELK
jgi:hypothetical protein